MRPSARALFIAATIMTALFCCGHFFGFLAAAYAARHDPGLAKLTADMRAQRTELLGFQPSILDFREYFSLNFSLLLLLVAGLNVILLRNARDSGCGLRDAALLNAVAMAILVGTSVLYSVPQGIISAGTIFLLYAGALAMACGRKLGD